MNNTKSNPLNNHSPFQILNINPSANKKEILRQVTIALKNRNDDARSIAQAQKLLFNPVSRAVEEFLYYISSDTYSKNKSKSKTKGINQQENIITTRYHTPELLNFDNEKTTT